MLILFLFCFHIQKIDAVLYTLDMSSEPSFVVSFCIWFHLVVCPANEKSKKKIHSESVFNIRFHWNRFNFAIFSEMVYISHFSFFFNTHASWIISDFFFYSYFSAASHLTSRETKQKMNELKMRFINRFVLISICVR